MKDISSDNVINILKDFTEFLENLEEEEREIYLHSIDNMLDDICSNDGFGKNNEDDPRNF